MFGVFSQKYSQHHVFEKRWFSYHLLPFLHYVIYETWKTFSTYICYLWNVKNLLFQQRVRFSNSFLYRACQSYYHLGQNLEHLMMSVSANPTRGQTKKIELRLLYQIFLHWFDCNGCTFLFIIASACTFKLHIFPWKTFTMQFRLSVWWQPMFGNAHTGKKIDFIWRL